MKIAVLNLNPGVDRVIYLGAPMQVGGMNRAEKTVFAQGSKAANQLILLSTLGGCEIDYISFTGGALGAVYEKYMDLPGVMRHFVPTRAGVRVNTKVIDHDGVYTELNERGGPVREDELERLITAMRKACGKADILTIAGSIPQGVEKSVYNSLIRENIAERVILDCDGEPLLHAISAAPYLIKPNRRELAELMQALDINRFSTDLSDFDELCRACGYLREKGVEILCTMDADGSLYVGKEGKYRVSAPPVEGSGFSGAGDTYLAAFTWARFVDCRPLPEALRFGAAAAAAKVSLEGTIMPDRDEIEAILPRVKTEKI